MSFSYIQEKGESSDTEHIIHSGIYGRNVNVLTKWHCITTAYNIAYYLVARKLLYTGTSRGPSAVELWSD